MEFQNVWKTPYKCYGFRAGFTMGQMGQLPRAPTNSTKLEGPHHKDNEIDLFRIVDFLMWQLQATEG